MTKRYYIPVETEEGARAVVSGIELGRIPCLPEYTDADQAAESFELYPRGSSYRLWCIERRAVDDAVITNIWPVGDKVGDMAAALLIVIGGCFAVGWGSAL